jgi:uncharacterized protein
MPDAIAAPAAASALARVLQRTAGGRSFLQDEAHRIHVADGGRERLAATVAALRSPDAYSDEVQRIEAIETHMAWVFLTEAHAYKLEKPIRTALFDYSSVDARRRACELELRLNRRLAPTVYLDVVPVTSTSAGLRVDPGHGERVDWLVKMRRLPRARMLDACINAGAVTLAEVELLADTLIGFYANAEPAGLDGPSYRARITADLAAKRASLEQPRYGLNRAEIAAVYASEQDWLTHHGPLLQARAAAVVDAHGDLRPEHVCLERPPVIIDCLQFNRDLRLLDPISELAYLALECRRLGAAWIGHTLLARYAAQTGVRTPEHLVEFYQRHHALIRAAIAVWHLDDDTLEGGDIWRMRAGTYLRLVEPSVAHQFDQ